MSNHGTFEAQQEVLYELARHDRQMSEHLYVWGERFHSVNDPIEAEIYRIRCELYCALAAGVDAEQAFQEHYERACIACERFNTKQEAALKGRRSWHNTDTGHFSTDAAWQRLRHALRMHKQIQKQTEGRERKQAKKAEIGALKKKMGQI